MKIMKTMVYFFLFFIFFTYASCSSTKKNIGSSDIKLVKTNASLSAGEGESEIRITWSGNSDKQKTSYPLAVIVDWYESDTAVQAGAGEKGRLAAQIDRGKSEKIIVKNGVNILHFAMSAYNSSKKTWSVMEKTKVLKIFPAMKKTALAAEKNAITGTVVASHTQNNLITMEVLDADMDWYPVNVKKSALQGQAAAGPVKTAQTPKPAEQPVQSGQSGSSVKYNVAMGNQSTGPFDIDELKQMRGKGQLTKESLVWKEGMLQWEVAGSIQELSALFQTIPGTPQIDRTEPSYTVALNGITAGPYVLDDIKPLINKGQLTRETLVWKEGAFQWSPASAVPEVAALFPQHTPVQTPSAAGPTTGSEAGKFFILVNDQPSGPLSADTLKQMIERRQFMRSSLVWQEGMPQWVAAETIAELSAIFPVIPPPPPPQPASSSIRYYIAVYGRTDGPYTVNELKQKLQSVQISQSTLVWKEDMPQWAAISSIPELGALFTKAEPAPQTVAQTDRQSPAAQPNPPPVRYHVAVNGLSTGPFSLDELKQKARSGQLAKSTQVWKSGMTQWAPAGTMADLQALFE